MFKIAACVAVLKEKEIKKKKKKVNYAVNYTVLGILVD